MNISIFLFNDVACILLVVTFVVASDYTWSIFGNANMDDTMNKDDVVIVTRPTNH
jgi:hypothetical protein